jgi:hypothetical protein
MFELIRRQLGSHKLENPLDDPGLGESDSLTAFLWQREP